MNKNSCQRFHKLMHRYELDLLSKSEKEEFELHLLECDSCFESVQKFKKAARHLVHSENVKRTVEQILEEHERSVGQRRKPIPARLSWKRYILAAAALLIIAFLVMQPWQIEIRPIQEVQAAENLMAIMYFNNLEDEEDSDRPGEIIANLLITDLSESKFIQVVTNQRLQDLERLFGIRANSADKDNALKIAGEARAKWLLLGNIIHSQPYYEVEIELLEVSTGNVIASEQIAGEADEDIFALVDRITIGIRKNLPLPLEAGDEPDKKVSEVTTASPEAYRYYLNGLTEYSRFYNQEAADNFRKAVELDSTFAMAYYYLAVTTDRRYLDQAVRYTDKASMREQYYIRALASEDQSKRREILEELIDRFPFEKEALFQLGNDEYAKLHLDSATFYMKRALEIDPLYKEAYNVLCYVYSELGDYAGAIGASDKYLSLAPNEANPYDTRGDLFAYFGEIDRAIEAYKKASDLKPNYHASIVKLGNLYLLQNEYHLADSCYKYLEANFPRRFRIMARFDMVNIPLRQGNLGEALKTLDSGFAKEECDLSVREEAILACDYLMTRAIILTYMRQYDSALVDASLGMEKFQQIFSVPSDNYLKIYAQILAEKGDFDSAREATLRLKERLEENRQDLDLYWSAAGFIALKEGNYKRAVEHFETIAGKTTIINDFVNHCLLAKAYLDSGQLNKAVSLYEKLQASFTNLRTREPIKDVKMHYYLGVAYEDSRWYDKAAEQYQMFLEIWKNADPGTDLIDDARKRLDHIKTIM